MKDQRQRDSPARRARRLAAFVALLFAVAARAAPPDAKEPVGSVAPDAEVQMDVNVGYTSYYNVVKPGAWHPVWITIKPIKRDLAGLVTLRQSNSPLQVEIAVQVPRGVAQRFLSYYRFDERLTPDLIAHLTARGLGDVQLPTTLRFDLPGEQHILALTDDPGGLRFLNRPSISAYAPNPAAAARKTVSVKPIVQGSWGGASVQYGSLAFLPDQAAALEGLDAIIVDASNLRELTEPQWEALQHWMAGGGRLLLAGGKLQPFIAQSAIGDALGVAPASPVPAILAPVMKAGKEAAAATTIPLLAAWPAHPGDDIRLGTPEQPLLVSRRVGAGWFFYCALALDDPAIQAINARVDARRFWPALLDRTRAGSALQSFVAGAGPGLTDQLEATFNFNLVGAGWVFCFIALYIVLALPVSAWLCRRFKRRDWFWPCAIVLALAFSWYGYSSGLSRQGKLLQTSELSFISRLDGNASYVRAFSTIYSPRGLKTDLSAPPGLFPYRPSSNSDYYAGGSQEDLYANQPLRVSFAQSATAVRELSFHPWSTRDVACDWLSPIQDSLTIKTPLAGGTLAGGYSGQFVNRTRWTFEKWWIADGETVRAGAGKIEPGATFDLTSLKREADATTELLVWIGGRLKRANPEESSDIRYSAAQGRNAFVPVASAPPQGRIAFIGAAEGTFDPLIDAMHIESRRGLVFYEQSLSAIPAAQQPAEETLRWTPRRIDLPGAAGDDPWSGNYSYRNQNPGDAGSVIIPLGQVDVMIAPDQSLDPGRWSAIELVFDFDSFPPGNHFNSSSYRPTAKAGGAPQGPAQNSRTNTAWKVAGAPVEIYNWRRDQWEPSALWPSGGVRLSPPGDYLAPTDASILLRIEASPERMQLRRIEDARPGSTGMTGTSGELATAAEVWPDGEYRYMGVAFQITHLKVRLIEPDPTAKGPNP